MTPVPPTAQSAAERLVTLLADRDPATATAAEGALCGMVLGEAPGVDAAGFLAVAVDRYVDHRCNAVAELLVRFRAGMAWHAVPNNPLMPILRDPGHPIHLVIRGLIRRGSLGDDTALLWRVMAEPAWAAACREHLSHRLTQAEKAELLASSHLGLNPIRAQLAKPRSPSAALAAAVEHGDPEALAQMAVHGNDRIAVAAARGLALSRAGDAAARVAREHHLSSMAGSSCPGVREVVRLAIAEDERAGARRRTRIGRDAAVHEFRAALTSAVPTTLLWAIGEVRRLRIAMELVSELCRIAAGNEGRAAAAACAALRSAADDRAFVALRHAAGADGHRVAATAVESIATIALRLGRFAEIEPLLTSALADDRHRVRAAAARAFAQARDPRGEETIRAMLADSRSGHRLAGLWGAERLLRAGLIGPGAELTIVLGRLAEEDRSSAIRIRACDCRELLRRIIQLGSDNHFRRGCEAAAAPQSL